MTGSWSRFGFQLPEALMALGVVTTVALGLITPLRRSLAVTACALLAVLAVLGVAAAGLSGAPLPVPAGALFADDGITRLARLAILGSVALALMAASGSRAIAASGTGAVFSICLLGLGLGALICAGATSLLTVFLGLEAMSLPSYLLAGLDRHEPTSAEAGMKYAMFGSLASGLSLFGMGLLLGLGGSLDLATLGRTLAALPPSASVGPLLLAASGIAFKLALVPFQAYVPDLYQGAPAVAAGAFSVIPKLAAFALLTRAMTLLVGGATADAAAGACALVGALTLLWGAIAALAQVDVRRILAYSAISHAGTMLLAFALWPERSALPALASYLLAYLFMNLGAFTALDALRGARAQADLTILAGSWQRQAGATAALVLALISLAGIPPLSGFFAKWLLLRELVMAGVDPGSSWLLALPCILLLGTVISAVAYLRIIRALLATPRADPGDAPLPGPDAEGLPFAIRSVLVITSLAHLLLGLALPWVADLGPWFR